MTLAGAPAVTRCDAAINNTWHQAVPVAGIPKDKFSVRWTRADTFVAGNYRFDMTGDDGIRIKLDGVTILNGWKDQSSASYSVVRAVTTGVHTVVVEYYDNSFDATAKASYVAVGGAPTPPPVTPSPTLPPAGGTNLISNPGVETGTAVPPTCWTLGGWGNGTRTQTYSSDRHGGDRAYQLTMAGRTSGDAKLMQSDATGCSPTVTPGKTYDLSVWFKSTSPTNAVTIFKQDAQGNWGYWTDVKRLPASAVWVNATATTPAIPAGTQRISWGVTLADNGTLLTDDYSMVLTGTPPVGTVTPVGLGGTWQTLNYTLPHRFIHSTVLRTGKVLLVAGSGNDPAAFLAGSFTASLWDPATGVFTELTVPEDMFCAGHVTLADGNVLIMGGTKQYSDVANNVAFEGLKSSYIFNVSTSQFQKINDAQTGHWYPTLTELGNGDVWAAGGLNEVGDGTVATEMFSNTSKQWLTNNQVPQTYSYWGTYPHMILMQDGRLFYSGAHTFGAQIPGTGASIYDWQAKLMQDVPGLRDKQTRDQAGSVLLPPAQDQRVGIFGGGDTEANAVGVTTTDVIDLKATAPGYHAAGDMPGPGKGYVNTVLLPNRTVLTTGGAQGNRGAAVRTAAVFNPITEKWLALPDEPNDRGYHGGAFLIPSGQVVVIGGNPQDNSFDLKISMFTPTYATVDRPAITAAPAALAYGGTGAISATTSNAIQYVSLVKPMSITHQTDPNARLVDLPFVTNADSSLTVTMPSNPNLAPPGPYMIVVQDQAGVPSVARWITVGPPCTTGGC